MEATKSHLKSCIKVYRYQSMPSRHFLHGHPDNARSWKEPSMIRVPTMQDNLLSRADQCQYGLVFEDKMGKALAKKPSDFLTNLPCIAPQLRRRCEGSGTHEGKRHVTLFNRVAKQAQVYPPGLCNAICAGLQEQIELDRRGQVVLLELLLPQTAPPLVTPPRDTSPMVAHLGQVNP